MSVQRPLLSMRPLALLLLLFCTAYSVQAQRYKYKARYDSLDTRHDLTRPLIERYFITANHGAACFNLGQCHGGAPPL